MLQKQKLRKFSWHYSVRSWGNSIDVTESETIQLMLQKQKLREFNWHYNSRNWGNSIGITETETEEILLTLQKNRNCENSIDVTEIRDWNVQRLRSSWQKMECMKHVQISWLEYWKHMQISWLGGRPESREKLRQLHAVAGGKKNLSIVWDSQGSRSEKLLMLQTKVKLGWLKLEVGYKTKEQKLESMQNNYLLQIQTKFWQVCYKLCCVEECPLEWVHYCCRCQVWISSGFGPNSRSDRGTRLIGTPAKLTSSTSALGRVQGKADRSEQVYGWIIQELQLEIDCLIVY